jgi:hypothetical protein
MGAEAFPQMRSDSVILTTLRPVTWLKTSDLAVHSNICAVVVLAVGGSNPLTHPT